MRTTITIEDSLLQKAKKISRQRRCSLREVIEDSLRAALAKAHKARRAEPSKRLKTFKGSGVQPGIDLSSSSALLDAMEAHVDKQVGSLKPGKLADVIAVSGDPIQDIKTLQSVAFVMKGGQIFKQ